MGLGYKEYKKGSLGMIRTVLFCCNHISGCVKILQYSISYGSKGELEMEGNTTKKEIAGIKIEISEKRIGEDIVLTLSGGSRPHIG